MAIVLNGTTGITNDGGYTGDGVVFADTTPANTLVTTNSGNVGIGTSSFAIANKLNIKQAADNSAAGLGLRVERNSNDSSLIFGYRDNSDTWQINATYGSTGSFKGISFFTADAERARIDSSGNLLVGTTSSFGARAAIVAAGSQPILTVANGATADSNVAIQVIKTGSTNNTSQRYIGFNYNGGGNGNGGIAGNGDSQATFITLSDERLKENITDLPSQLDNVMALRPVEFDYKATGGHQIGFIAQEVQAVYPDLVSEDDEGYLSLAGFDKNTSRLIKAIQEQQAMIVQLQADVAALKGTTNV